MSAIERRSPLAAMDRPEQSCRDETVLLEWTVHLFRQDPRRAWGILLAAALSAGLGFLLFFSPLLALIGPILLFTACAEFVFPIHYRLTTERAMVSYGLARLDLRWENVKRILEGPDAFRLSPFARDNRLDGIRGVTLRWRSAGEFADRESVFRIIRERTRDAGKVEENQDV